MLHLIQEAMQDQSFFTCFQQGEHTAYTELYNRYFKRLYYFSLKLTQDHFEAEDISIETLRKIIERRLQYSSLTELVATAMAITKNSSIDYLRKTRRKEELLKKLSATEILPYTYDTKELSPPIIKGLSLLSVQQRSALYLRYEKNLTVREVGQQMNVGQKSAEKLIQRAIIKLRQAAKKN